MREDREREIERERTSSPPKSVRQVLAGGGGGYSFPPPKRPTTPHHTYPLKKRESFCGEKERIPS